MLNEHQILNKRGAQEFDLQWPPLDSAANEGQNQDRLAVLDDLIGFYQIKNQQAWSTNQLSAFFADCQHYCFWPLIIKAASQNLSQLSTKELETASYAAFQMGYIQLARTFIRRGLLLEPESEYLLQISQDLKNWVHFAQQYQFADPYPSHGDSLYLQLLGHHHIDSFMAVYDQETAALCCLPAFIDDWDWHQWLDGQYQPGDELTFAVMHPDFGMVGSVSLVLHDNTGFFYYWIGGHFRGHGFGPLSVNLLLEMAHYRYGLERCYAKVFEHNQSSRRGLQKLGFKQLPIRAAEPYTDEIYYCLGDISDLDAVTEDMYRFYQKMRCWKPFTRPLTAFSSSGSSSLDFSSLGFSSLGLQRS